MNKSLSFDENKKYNILLLTHVSSDNLGDQMIEICSNALVRMVMSNLNLDDNYQLISVDASIVNARYLSFQSEEQPRIAEKLISQADLIVFGGSPVFNYTYEGFSERTVKTLNIIKKHAKPVIFSAIGIEEFNGKNHKCLRLKNALNDKNIKMITTRDNFDALVELTRGTSIKIAKVADPAVFSAPVMNRFISEKTQKKDRKKIGVFVIRGNAFKDNGFDFANEETVEFWKNLVKELESRNFDYELLTSGSHADELYLDKLTMEYGFKGAKCACGLNTSEELISRLDSYDGVISCRLHPSIISYSMNIPSVGLVWNKKVPLFYQSVGYGDRVLSVEEMLPKNIVDKLERAIADGVTHNTDFLMSVYKNLFECIKELFKPDSEEHAYDYPTLRDALSIYAGSDYPYRIKTKMARIYRTTNQFMKMRDELKQIKLQRQEFVKKYEALHQKVPNDTEIQEDIRKQSFTLFYNIQKKEAGLNPFEKADLSAGTVFERKNSYEYRIKSNIINNGKTVFLPVMAKPKIGYSFAGYRLRASLYGCNFVLLKNGKWIASEAYKKADNGDFALFQPGELIPIVDLNFISALIAVIVWKKE